MTATVFIQTVGFEEPKRVRRVHQKVRTGCLTCKTRRKKCDEAKPSCRRCTSTGRQCEGYGPEPTITAPSKDESDTPDSGVDCKSPPTSHNAIVQKSAPEINHLLSICRALDTTHFSSEQDYYCFDFFRTRTGPEVAAYFDSSIWRTFMIRACFIHPTVLQAAAAVGAVHRRYELGISREAFEFCEIADKQYKKAVNLLQKDLSTGHPNAPEIDMMVSMLLGVFETFQGNPDRALQHSTTGIKQLLNRSFRTTHSEKQYKTAEVSRESLLDLLKRFEVRALAMLQNQANILQQPNQEDSMAAIPKTFEDIKEARDVLFTEARWIWHTWRQLEKGIVKNFSNQHAHISRLLEWSMAYAEWSKAHRSQITSQDIQIAQLLKCYREVLYLSLLTQLAFHDESTGVEIVPLCSPPEECDCHDSCRDYAQRRSALNAHFARVMVLSEPVFDDASQFAYDEHSFSVDSGISPSIFLGTPECRSTKVRHQVTSLLSRRHLQEKVWNTKSMYSIAEKLSTVEEHALLAAKPIPQHADAKWVDVTFFLEERKVILRHCQHDIEFGGLIWTQEWVTF